MREDLKSLNYLMSQVLPQNSEYLMSEIIPYCSENFVTIPLWEEGDYRIQMNLWYIIRLNEIQIGIEDVDANLNLIIKILKTTFQDFEIHYEREDRPVDKQSFIEFGISQVCEDILDESFVYNYNFYDYMIVAVRLLGLLKDRLK